MSTRAAKSAAAEKKLHRSSGSTRREASGATSDVGDLVSDALERIMDRVRDSAAGVTQSVTAEASRFGTDAFKKLTREIESRPLVLLGVAAGLGFLFGMTKRR